MNKKLISTLALSLCFVMSAGAFAGCKDPEDKPLTQDEIYAKVVEAAKATAAYTGAYTTYMVEKETGKENDPEYTDGEETYTEEESMTTSVDAAAKKLYMKAKEVNAGEYTETEEMVGKLFKEGDKYYTYTKMKSTSTEEGAEPQEQERYVGASEVAVAVSFAQYSLANSDYYSMADESITSIDAYNAAWASYVADSKAEIVAGSTDEESDWYKCTNPEGSYVLSAEEVDGAYVVTIKLTASLANEYSTMEGAQETKVTAKDGKIISVTEKNTFTETSYKLKDADDNWESVTKDTQGAQKATSSEVYETTMTISYEFAQADYDAVTTTLPTDVQMQPDYISKDLEIVVDGVNYGENYVYGNTVAETFNGLGNRVSDYNSTGIDFAWYTDAACTQAIDPEAMTAVQFLALDTVYGKATAQEGYVLYTAERVYEYAADVPEAYKTALASMMGNSSRKTLKACTVESGITIYDDYGSVTVNGEAVDFSDNSYVNYEVEAGKTYAVKYTYAYEKAMLNFFYMALD